MQTSNGVNKTIIIVAGVLIALVLVLVLVWPQYQKLQALKLDIRNRQADLLSQETYFSQIKEIATQLQSYPDALAKISSALPQDPSLAALVNFLQVDSAQTGLILKKIVLGGTTLPSENQRLMTETRLVIQVSGSYTAFKDFLALVENSARLIKVDNLSIEIPTKDSKESPTFTLDLRTTSY